MAHLKNRLNEYAGAVGLRMFDAVPKAVWCALAVSSLTQGGDYLSEAEQRVLREWWALYNAGIVPQRPYLPEPPVAL